MPVSAVLFLNRYVDQKDDFSKKVCRVPSGWEKEFGGGVGGGWYTKIEGNLEG